MKQSLADEIVQSLRDYKDGINAGDKHFNEGVFPSNRSAAIYCINNCIGNVNAIIEARRWERQKRKKKSTRKRKNS